MIFIKRIPSIEDYPLETSQVVVDKQLRHIAILDANRDCVYLLTTIMVMHHIIEFKTNFEQDHHFAMNTTLKPHRTIKNSKSAAMLSIMFGKIQEREVLAISYYNGLIEIYQSKKNWSIWLNLNMNPRLARVQLIDSTLYAIQYSKDVNAYDISHQGTLLKQNIENARHILIQTKFGVLYESGSGELISEKETIIKVQQKQTESFIEDLETDNFISSFCEQYIVRLAPCTIYKVEKQNKVTEICNLDGFPTVVSISPFEYENGAVVLIVLEDRLELRRLTKDKYKGSPILLEINNMKHQIVKIVWIGPFQILLLNEEQQMVYLQIFSSKLFI